MSLASAKKLLLSGGKVKPFQIAGSFETNAEGWLNEKGELIGGGDGSATPDRVRSGKCYTSISDYIKRDLSSSLARKSKVTASIYARYIGAGATLIVNLEYKLAGQSSWTAFATRTYGDDGRDYRQIIGTFNTGSGGASVRVRTNGITAFADDWMISGEPL